MIFPPDWRTVSGAQNHISFRLRSLGLHCVSSIRRRRFSISAFRLFENSEWVIHTEQPLPQLPDFNVCCNSYMTTNKHSRSSESLQAKYLHARSSDTQMENTPEKLNNRSTWHDDQHQRRNSRKVEQKKVHLRNRWTGTRPQSLLGKIVAALIKIWCNCDAAVSTRIQDLFRFRLPLPVEGLFQ